MFSALGDKYADAKRDHENNLRARLHCCADKYIRLSKQKMKLSQKSLNFIDHEFIVHDLRRDPSKVDAIMHIPRPSDMKGVKRRLGMMTFHSCHISRFFDVSASLRQLINSKTPFHWDQTTHGIAFDNLKRYLAYAKVLAYNDVSKPAVIHCDSSQP